MTDFSDLNAVFVNCTLKKSPQQSNTSGLMNAARAIMTDQGVSVTDFRLVDHDVAPGVSPDMTEQGCDTDVWPAIWDTIRDAEILVIGTPIWLGMHSSECKKLIERLYGQSGQTNDKDQYVFYGKVGGCIVTGNEDGIKHVGMGVLYALQHIGYTIPPQADCGWIGEAGPGPSFLDDGSGGPENEFTQRNTTFMAWNLMHMARMLKDRGGIPAEGNTKSDWECHKGEAWPNPEHR